MAAKHNLCVGGYYNIIIFDGTQKRFRDRMLLVNDHRSKLAAEITLAYAYGHLSREDAFNLIAAIFFKRKSFREVSASFWKVAKAPQALSRLLRGYKK